MRKKCSGPIEEGVSHVHTFHPNLVYKLLPYTSYTMTVAEQHKRQKKPKALPFWGADTSALLVHILEYYYGLNIW